MVKIEYHCTVGHNIAISQPSYPKYYPALVATGQWYTTPLPFFCQSFKTDKIHIMWRFRTFIQTILCIKHLGGSWLYSLSSLHRHPGVGLGQMIGELLWLRSRKLVSTQTSCYKQQPMTSALCTLPGRETLWRPSPSTDQGSGSCKSWRWRQRWPWLMIKKQVDIEARVLST